MLLLLISWNKGILSDVVKNYRKFPLCKTIWQTINKQGTHNGFYHAHFVFTKCLCVMYDPFNVSGHREYKIELHIPCFGCKRFVRKSWIPSNTYLSIKCSESDADRGMRNSCSVFWVWSLYVSISAWLSLKVFITC